jgi:hypothetical protein
VNVWARVQAAFSEHLGAAVRVNEEGELHEEEERRLLAAFAYNIGRVMPINIRLRLDAPAGVLYFERRGKRVELIGFNATHLIFSDEVHP